MKKSLVHISQLPYHTYYPAIASHLTQYAASRKAVGHPCKDFSQPLSYTYNLPTVLYIQPSQCPIHKNPASAPHLTQYAASRETATLCKHPSQHVIPHSSHWPSLPSPPLQVMVYSGVLASAVLTNHSCFSDAVFAGGSYGMCMSRLSMVESMVVYIPRWRRFYL